MNALLTMMIISCWTPTDSMNLAQKYGYELATSTEKNNYLIETWLVDGRVIDVVYEHPLIGNPDLWCYKSEHEEEGRR